MNKGLTQHSQIESAAQIIVIAYQEHFTFLPYFICLEHFPILSSCQGKKNTILTSGYTIAACSDRLGKTGLHITEV
jgi:hypothetical protein